MSLPLSQGQQLALDQLEQLVAASSGAIDLPTDPLVLDGGLLQAVISLDCTDTPSSATGLRLRKRERFLLFIPPGFPFEIPVIRVPHRRWASTPHVQWGCQLCIYAAPSVEWVPADGMFGLIERLVLWLEHAALDELDPDDQPLHPPVAYVAGEHGVIVVRADLGDLAPTVADLGRHARSTESPGTMGARTDEPHRFVVGIAKAYSDTRSDVVEWIDRVEWRRRFSAGELATEVAGYPLVGAVGLLTAREMDFEYPTRAVELVAALDSLGVPQDQLFAATSEVAAINYALACKRARGGTVLPTQLNLFVGTPSRRMSDRNLRQHLVCWRFDEIGRLVAENIIFADSDQPALAHLAQLAHQLLPGWIADTNTSWVRVMEARPEVTIRRDANSTAEWIHGRRVLILGCGALGGPVAELCLRGGAKDISVIDNDVVTPGILVRQPYIDDDIGAPKALALATRLNRIRQDQPVRPAIGSAQAVVLYDGAPPPDVDLVIDATADATVASLLELRRSQSRASWPPVMSMLIGHDARRGIVTMAKRGATGAGRHLLRQLSLAGRGRHADELEDVMGDFFPTEARSATFQPEPGCSSPTFTGSATDLAALAGHLFDAGLRVLSDHGSNDSHQPMVAAAVRLGDPSDGFTQPGAIWFGWPDDMVCHDAETGYEVRISQPALARLRAEVRHGARLRGPKIETGGLLLGQIDDACQCIWVDDVSGPPPDSLLSAVHFDHGVEGVEALLTYYGHRSGGSTGFVGMWHSHPYGEAAPSPTDRVAMKTLVTPLPNNPIRALVVIVGGDDETWTGWVDEDGTPDVFARLVRRELDGVPGQAPPVPTSHQSEGWPGGWSSRPRTNSSAKSRVRSRVRSGRIRRLLWRR